MATRLELHEELVKILGSRNVYFNPPETLKLNYPCIVYSLSSIRKEDADDSTYKINKAYSITLIHKDPDNDIVDKILLLPMCKFDRPFVSDNLYHYVFTKYI